jgi:hypothetical protein
MAKLSIMDHTGHSTVDFDKADTVSSEAAMARFAELVGDRKYTAATRKAGEHDYKVVRSFADVEDETLLKPPLQGG